MTSLRLWRAHIYMHTHTYMFSHTLFICTYTPHPHTTHIHTHLHVQGDYYEGMSALSGLLSVTTVIDRLNPFQLREERYSCFTGLRNFPDCSTVDAVNCLVSMCEWEVGYTVTGTLNFAEANPRIFDPGRFGFAGAFPGH